MRLARPRNSLMALIDEMLGETTDDSQAIYLSDGGHFENLGLYEMFRRRCSSILVVDAGADEACSLTDLGNAIRKAEIDFGIRVAMQEPCRLILGIRLEGESDLTAAALGFAYGDIESAADISATASLLKPSFWHRSTPRALLCARSTRRFPPVHARSMVQREPVRELSHAWSISDRRTSW